VQNSVRWLMKNFVDSLDVVLQIIKSLIKLIVLKTAVNNYSHCHKTSLMRCFAVLVIWVGNTHITSITVFHYYPYYQHCAGNMGRPNTVDLIQ